MKFFKNTLKTMAVLVGVFVLLFLLSGLGHVADMDWIGVIPGFIIFSMMLPVALIPHPKHMPLWVVLSEILVCLFIWAVVIQILKRVFHAQPLGRQNQ